MTQSGDIDLSIIIVNWNTRDCLRDCLASIFQAADSLVVEAIVVDNASDDGSVEMVKRDFPHVQLVQNRANLGFAAACNQGLAIGRGRYAMLLNPDTRIVGNALQILVQCLDSHPDVGLVGPQILDQEGVVQSSCYEYPSLLNIFFEATLLFRLFPHSPLFGRYRLANWPHDEKREVDWMVGAALLARREAIQQVGPLDEGYFLYAEDIDWCYRFWRLGWRVLFYPDAQVIHLENRSAGQRSDAMKIEWSRSRVRYMRLHHGILPALLTRLMLALGYLLRLVLWSGVWLLARGTRRDRARQRIRQWAPALGWCLGGKLASPRRAASK